MKLKENEIDASEFAGKKRPDPEVHKILRDLPAYRYHYRRTFNFVSYFYDFDEEKAAGFLDQALDVLSLKIEELEKLRKNKNGTLLKLIDYYTAHKKYCSAIKSLLKRNIDQTKKYLKEGLELFERAGDEYNAKFLNAQLMELEKKSFDKESTDIKIKIPTLEKNLYFVVENTITKNIDTYAT